MNTERFRVKVALGLLLQKDGKVLLSRRSNTGRDDGQYGLIAGHLEGGESLTAAMCREAKEETGITVGPQDLTLIHTMHRLSDTDYLEAYFMADKWEGDPYNAEPEKCDDLQWFDINDLPDTTQPFVRQVIENYLNSVRYSEVGW